MSDKVAVIARITVRPDAVAEAEPVLRGLVDATAAEDGTLLYALHREGDSGSFWFYELYADAAALDAHGKGPALAEAFGTLGPLLAEPPELRLVSLQQAKNIDL
ncbi:MAG: putative quinol monooxygenase [Acidimicrobiales bacterium]